MELIDFIKGLNLNPKILTAQIEKGMSLHTIAKAVILSFKELKSDKYLPLKEQYINEVIKEREKNSIKDFDENQKCHLRDTLELEVEVLKAKIEVITKSLER